METVVLRGVALAACTEVLQCSLSCDARPVGKISALGAINYNAENAEETFNPSVAIFEHANRIIEPAVDLCADLNRHDPILFASVLYDCRRFDG